MTAVHICQPGYRHLASMAEFYEKAGLVPDSKEAKIALVRSHIAYWSGLVTAERIVIMVFRKHTFRAGGITVRVVDMADHRNGVRGWHDRRAA